MCTTCLWPPPLGVDLLVRATWDRRVDHPERYLWASMAAQPEAGTLTLEVSRRGAQPARLPLDGTFWSGKPVSTVLWKGFIGVTFGDLVAHLCCPMLAKKPWATDNRRPTLA
jgi:hypothetical protein